MLSLYRVMGKLFRYLPKVRRLSIMGMDANFFVPINNHYICDDLVGLSSSKREPRLYAWLRDLPRNSLLFDVGTSYGQESALASSQQNNGVRVVGFDCGLYQSHFCCLNKSLNEDRFRFVFAAVGERSGDTISVTSNSDTHIPKLHKKNVPYTYDVMTLALDDFAKREQLSPTHLKIDVDGAELSVLKGAASILRGSTIKEVFIEIDHKNKEIVEIMDGFGFRIAWREQKTLNDDVMFRKR